MSYEQSKKKFDSVHSLGVLRDEHNWVKFKAKGPKVNGGAQWIAMIFSFHFQISSCSHKVSEAVILALRWTYSDVKVKTILDAYVQICLINNY